MEERDRGVDEERFTRNPKSNKPVSYLVKAATNDDVKQLSPMIEHYLEQKRDGPENQSGHKESTSLAAALSIACSCHLICKRRSPRQ